MTEKELQEAIEMAQDIARTGNSENKADFVEYISAFIRWNSGQFEEVNRINVGQGEKIYKAYLQALEK